jgi:hypothetical protein
LFTRNDEVILAQLEQPQVGAVARDERRAQPRAGRRAVGAAAGHALAGPDHLARGGDDDVEHVTVALGGGDGTGRIGQGAQQRVGHPGGIVLARGKLEGDERP